MFLKAPYIRRPCTDMASKWQVVLHIAHDLLSTILDQLIHHSIVDGRLAISSIKEISLKPSQTLPTEQSLSTGVSKKRKVSATKPESQSTPVQYQCAQEKWFGKEKSDPVPPVLVRQNAVSCAAEFAALAGASGPPPDQDPGASGAACLA